MGKYEKEIKAYALRNAVEFGKADASKILPKLFQHGLLKEEIKEVMPEIVQIVKEVNKFSEQERKKLLEEFKDSIKIREEKDKGLAELPGIEKIKKLVFRAAPFPSGALHLGNAKTFMLNYLYAEKYNGKLFLVMDDTIGSAEKPINKESYKLIEDAFKWLGITYTGKIIYKSDRLKTYYEYAGKLIEREKAYVCHCYAEELRKLRAEGIECGCRVFPKRIQLARWKQMFKMKEGEATLRIKTDMLHPNPAFRDRVLFKISDREHPRTGKKYSVWPTLEMSWAIDDYLLKITHIIRGNDLVIESEMEKYIWNIFKWKEPEIIHTGMVNIEGAKLSKSKAQKEVASGEYIGWDDPRTWSIQSLKRRGIKPEAIKEFIKEIGLNKQDITVPIDNLYSINRKIIDKDADRYSFIINPIKLNISNKPNWNEVKVPIHPDKDKKRNIKLSDIFISKADFNAFKGKEVRLLHLYNIKLNKNSEMTSIDNKELPRINWVSDNAIAKILMPNGVWLEGITEADVADLKKGSVVQFERFGFAKLDNAKDSTYEFWFAHR